MADTDYRYITLEDLLRVTDRFFRDLPLDRSYVLAVGLEQAFHYVETLSFLERAIDCKIV